MNARIDFRDIMRAAGFEQNRVIRVAQYRHQRQHILLQQGFAAGDLHQGTSERRYDVDNLFESLFFSFVKRVLRVAVVAAKIAEGQPHKDARLPRPGALALDRVINLVNCQRLFLLLHRDVESLTRYLAQSLTRTIPKQISPGNTVFSPGSQEHHNSRKIRRLWGVIFMRFFLLTTLWRASTLAAMRTGLPSIIHRFAPLLLRSSIANG